MRAVLVVLSLCLMISPVLAGDYSGKKVLWIDSYHKGYAWSDGIENGIKDTLEGKNITLEILRMDTKRNTAEEFKVGAAEKAKAKIEQFLPDVVIATDDNASKYLISKYYRDARLPVVFAGVNWSAEEYGYPFSNVTGMIEVNAANEMADILFSMAKGEKLAILTSDVHTEHKDTKFTNEVYGFDIDAKYVKSFEEWKKSFVEMQDQYDAIIVQNNAGLADWDDAEAEKFALENTKVPTGTYYEWMSHVATVVYGKLPEEQGEYAAKTVLSILDGKRVSEMPLTRNRRSTLIVNTKITQASGIKVPVDILEAADKIIE